MIVFNIKSTTFMINGIYVWDIRDFKLEYMIYAKRYNPKMG